MIREAADVDLFAERNHAFHARLFQASGRKQLCRTMIVLRNSVERYIRIGAFIAGNLDRVKLDHYRIVEASGAAMRKRPAASAARIASIPASAWSRGCARSAVSRADRRRL
ncbi:MAG: FCD domain-containing protein [Pseudomonadota bacterium]